jgi:hypothetical protein
MAGVSWGAHPSCLILLYRELIESVLKYGSVCFTNMSGTHMLCLERGAEDCIGSDGIYNSTPNNCLGVLSGIPPLGERFTNLNFRYLIATFYRLGHPLRERLGA